MPTEIGSLPRNLHHGSRTEYLAQYVFSGLGSAFAVPHQEDSGIDLYCTLGTPDPDEHRRLSCRHPFYIQVKSKTAPLEYSNQAAVKWLTSLPQPYFVCVINQEELRFQVYHSLPIFLVTIVRQLPEKLTFVLGENDQWNIGDDWIGRFYNFQVGKIYTSVPVLDFTLEETIKDLTWYEKTIQVLEGWLILLEFNIAMRTVGLPIVRFPDEYKTNEPLEVVDHVNDPVRPGGFYTETSNPEYARERKDFSSLLKRVYASLLFFRDVPDEIGDKVAWLLEQELTKDGHPISDLPQENVYHIALGRYRLIGASKKH